MRHPLHSICPYFAMFPESFVAAQVARYTDEDDYVFDPFSGRGTTMFESLMWGRNAAALDINPVAYCLTKAKAEAPDRANVLARLEQLEAGYDRREVARSSREAELLPPFFRRGFYHSTLRELLFLRRELRWQDMAVDTFITAMILGSLHGEMDSPSYFSNQMPRTICLKPKYSLRYWSRHQMFPKKREVFRLLTKKTDFRLSGDLPARTGIARLGDARLAAKIFPNLRGRIRLVVTSPPYLNVTRYEEDQWLRLWFLGGKPNPTYGVISKDDRHELPDRYWNFLTAVWYGIKPLLRDDAVMVIRIGTKSLPLDLISRGLRLSLREVFPRSRWVTMPVVSKISRGQISSFNPKAKGCDYEIDFVYRPYA